MKEIKKTLFALLSMSLLASCGVGNSAVSSIIDSVTGDTSTGTSQGGDKGDSSSSQGGASSSDKGGDSSSISVADGSVSKAQLLAIANLNLAHEFAEVTSTSKTVVGTAETNEGLVTTTKGNEIKAVSTTSSYTKTSYFKLDAGYLKTATIYTNQAAAADGTENVNSAATYKIVTAESNKQGEMSETSAQALLDGASGFAKVNSFLKQATTSTEGKLTANKSGTSIVIKWIYGDEKMMNSFAITLSVDSAFILTKASVVGGTYNTSDWDATNEKPKDGVTALVSNTTTMEATKESVTSVGFDATPYFITAVTAYSVSQYEVTSTVGVGDVVRITPATFTPSTAINYNDFIITDSSDKTVIAYNETSFGYVALKEGESTLSIANVDGSVTSSLKVTVSATSPSALNGSYKGTLTDEAEASYEATINFAQNHMSADIQNADHTMMINVNIDLVKTDAGWSMNEGESVESGEYRFTSFDVSKIDDTTLQIEAKFAQGETQYVLTGTVATEVTETFAYAGLYSGNLVSGETSVAVYFNISNDKSFTLTPQDEASTVFYAGGTITEEDGALTAKITVNNDGVTYTVKTVAITVNPDKSLALTVVATKDSADLTFTGTFAIAEAAPTLDDFIGVYGAKTSDEKYSLSLTMNKNGVAVLTVTNVESTTVVATLHLQFTINADATTSVAITDEGTTSSLTLDTIGKDVGIMLSGSIVLPTETLTLSSMVFTMGGGDGGETSEESGEYSATVTKDEVSYTLNFSLNNGIIVISIEGGVTSVNLNYAYTMDGTTFTLGASQNVIPEGLAPSKLEISLDAAFTTITFDIEYTYDSISVALAGTAAKAAA